MESEIRHQCMIYDGPPSQTLAIMAAIINRRLEEGYRCLYLNSPTMVAGLRSTLSAMDMNVASEIAKARLVLSSAQTLTNGHFDTEKMIEMLEDSLNQALDDGYKGLWASGDMSWEFGPKKDFSRLLEYELRLEEVFSKRKELVGICQYHKEAFPQDALRQSLLVHNGIVINDALSRVNPLYLRASWPTSSPFNAKLDLLINELCR